MNLRMLLNDQHFLNFLVAAKQSGYASGGDAKAEQLSDGGKRYRFQHTNWPGLWYEDIYHGLGKNFNPFAGHEAAGGGLQIPIFRMSYDGFAIGGEEQVARTVNFVQQMLQKVSPRFPFRGPESLDENGLRYLCSWAYDDDFRIRGSERVITLNNQTRIYQLNFLVCALV